MAKPKRKHRRAVNTAARQKVFSFLAEILIGLISGVLVAYISKLLGL